MTRTVIFDLGGVYFADGTLAAVDAIAQTYRLDRDAVDAVLNGDPGRQYRIGRISAEQFWQQAMAHWHIQALPEALARIWHSSYAPNEGTVRIVEKLKGAGHELLYLSDNTPDRVAYLDAKYFFLQKFNDGIFSHIAKCRKPDPMIYKLAAAKAAHPAAECVYIDDKPHYLAPARSLGMQVIAFKNAVQLEADLTELGLKF